MVVVYTPAGPAAQLANFWWVLWVWGPACKVVCRLPPLHSTVAATTPISQSAYPLPLPPLPQLPHVGPCISGHPADSILPLPRLHLATGERGAGLPALARHGFYRRDSRGRHHLVRDSGVLLKPSFVHG